MRIKKLIWCLLFFSCSVPNESETNEDVVDQGSNDIIEFETPIKPRQTEFDLNAIYTDTLEFIRFNDDYDYWFAEMKTLEGESVSLNYSGEFDDPGNGSILLVDWKVDSFYEAGEGEQLYYDLILQGFEVLEEKLSFKAWLENGFLDDLLKNESAVMNQYAHPELKEILMAYNPGAYCAIGEGGFLPDFTPDFNNGYVVEEGLPSGDFCEGYPNASAGFYIEQISESQLPAYADMSLEQGDDFGAAYTPDVPQGGADNYYKIAVISDEFQYAYLYFLEYNGEFYFWIKDLCDCSA
jgi:hypothetical protein